MARIFKLKTLGALTALGTAGALVYFHDPRASAFKYIVMPAGRLLVPDGELAHNLTITYFKLPFIKPQLPKKWLSLVDPEHKLEQTVCDKPASSNVPRDSRVRSLKLATPVGIAAGFDKGANVIDTLFGLGFSWVEIGSVTPLEQPGNPRPRVFRLVKDKAFVNRFGFNSEGHAVVADRIRALGPLKGKGANPDGKVLAVNLGKNKTGDEVEDYVKGVHTFGELADALVVNVSSPNTPGLRDLQDGGKLGGLLTRLVKERNSLKLNELPPLLVKIAPDLSVDQVKAIASAVKSSGIDGVVVGNTTIQRPEELKSSPELIAETGGLSGPPVKPFEIKVLKALRAELGPDLTVIGCGGVSTADDALEFAKSGADLVQLYTSLAYDGPGVPSLLTEDLIKKLGSQTWSQYTGRS